MAYRLGSAKHGTGAWLVQRLSAFGLVPLGLWFVAGLIGHLGLGYDQASAWLGSLFPAAAMVLFLVAGFAHLVLGVQSVIEDYVHHRGAKVASLILLRLACWALGAAGLLAVLRVATRA